MKLECDLKDKNLANQLVQAIKPEITSSSEKFSRSNIEIGLKGKIFFAEIEAADITAAKASFNSLISWISSSLVIFQNFNKTN